MERRFNLVRLESGAKISLKVPLNADQRFKPQFQQPVLFRETKETPGRTTRMFTIKQRRREGPAPGLKSVVLFLHCLVQDFESVCDRSDEVQVAAGGGIINGDSDLRKSGRTHMTIFHKLRSWTHARYAYLSWKSG